MTPIVAIGGSAGALEALLKIMPTLPPDLAAAVLVIVHMSPDQPSRLAAVLDRAGPLPALPARDGEPIRPGQVYVAVPDHHLLVEDGHLRLTRGPRENRSRPSIDVLFRSAALSCGPRLAGVLLSGMLDDGASGLWAVRQLGGCALVQHPEDALYPAMPLAALRGVEVQGIVHTTQIGPTLGRWVTGLQAGRLSGQEVKVSESERRRLEQERDIAAGANALEAGVLDQGPLSPFTCPECHGVLVRLVDEGVLRFRCHTGHAYSVETLLADLRQSAEAALWQAARVLDEQGLLLDHLGTHLDSAGQGGTSLSREALASRERADQVRRLAQAAAAPEE